MLSFTDGVEINTSGKIRIILLSDGYYVIGGGMCIPCNSKKEAEELVNELK